MKAESRFKMASSTGAKRKGNFKLDIDDMERRLVEFRVSLDREKRRCQAAKMTDKFEKLLTDKLTEIGSQLTASVGDNGGNGPAQDGQENNGLKLTHIDEESAGRLNNLLISAITMSARVDQLDSIHDILRKCLLETRLKRVRTAAELPPGQAKPLEPLCGYCGKIAIEEPIPTMDELRQSFSQYDPPAPNSSTSLRQVTPPASNPTTPEVGEQAIGATSYTPNFGGGGGGGCHANHQERQQVLVLQRPIIIQQQPAAQPQQPPQQQSQYQPQQQQQQPSPQQQKLNYNNHTNASNSSSRFVMPSDESSTDSDHSTNSVRDVLDKLAHTPAGYHEPRQLSSTPVQPEKEMKKKKKSAEEDDERPSRLVIDEGLDRFFTEADAPKVSFVSKSIKNGGPGPRSKKRPKRLNYSQEHQ